jgi:hypothetical protein
VAKKRTTRLRKPSSYLLVLVSVKEKNKLPKMKNLQWYSNRLTRYGYIKRVGYGTWEVTKDGERFFRELRVKSESATTPIKLDAVLKITMPVVKVLGKIPKNHSELFRSWMEKYKWQAAGSVKLTVKGPTTKNNLILDIPRIYLKDTNELEVIVNRVKEYAREFYQSKGLLQVDLINTRVSNVKYGLRYKPFTEAVERLDIKGIRRRLYLNRTRRKLLPADEDKRAWVEGPCSTPFKWTIHSNDSKYVDNFLLLPERVDLLWNFLKDKLPCDKPLKDRSVWDFV